MKKTPLPTKGYSKSPKVLTLGDKRLYQKSKPVKKSELARIKKLIPKMHELLLAYRQEYGKYRAIAAPQIGIFKRFFYMFTDKPTVFINPTLKDKSRELMEVWDDCMSFPDLLVKVKRHKQCTIEYCDLDWQKQSMKLEDDMSELIQHEYDHLDGILATQRAIDNRSFAVFKK